MAIIKIHMLCNTKDEILRLDNNLRAKHRWYTAHFQSLYNYIISILRYSIVMVIRLGLLTEASQYHIVSFHTVQSCESSAGTGNSEASSASTTGGIKKECE